MFRRTFLILSILVGVAAIGLVATLPPAPAVVADAAWTPAAGVSVVRGAIHVHTTRSDGGGTMDEIAAAAARAGLGFVVFTDHGDATRPPETPAYRSGVLCMDGVEISTRGGHYVALDMPAAPYPLGGDARDVVADVARLGGFGVAAHPTSPRRSLQWADWVLRVDGIEWLNADSEWRDESWVVLSRLLFDYLIRPAPALASVLDRPVAALARWDSVTAARRIVAIGAADAHGRIDIGGDDATKGWLSRVLPAPSYEASFRTFATYVELPDPLSGEAATDAHAIMGAIRGGRLFTGIDAVARPVLLDFRASSGDATARMGETLIPQGPVRIEARSGLPPGGGEVCLVRDGRDAVVERAPALTYEAPAESAVYRVEVRLPRAPGTPPVPWIVSNPIYVGPREPGSPPPAPLPAGSVAALYTDEAEGQGSWAVEVDPESRAALSFVPNVGGFEIAFRFALRGAPVASQYAAMVRPVGREIAGKDRLMFTARASRPMRVEVQLREPNAGPGERWEHSVYLDEEPRRVTLFFRDFLPVLGTARPQPNPSLVDSLLFVVDTTHTAPATAGVVWLDDVKLGGV